MLGPHRYSLTAQSTELVAQSRQQLDETDLAIVTARLAAILGRAHASNSCLLLVRTALRCTAHAVRALHVGGS